ncbi:hypothetical protein ACQY0O_005927 [Thecaphora frezii]
MAKGGARGKSSASSATRKKQAAKAQKKLANERDEDGNLLHPEAYEALQRASQPPQRGQKKDKHKHKDKGKGKGKADKKKQFVPPPKPPQPLPDPLDSMGLASLLPADLVVLLRKASKKDVVTRCRALEGLLAWIEDALQQPAHADTQRDKDASDIAIQEKQEALVMLLPCWVHLFPRLALSPTRRLRLLTSQIQALLLQQRPVVPKDGAASSSSTRTELLESPAYINSMLGPWAILSNDVDRSIERIGSATWRDSVTWNSSDELGESEGGSRLPLIDYIDNLLDHLRLLLQSPSPSAALALTAAHASNAARDAPSASASGVNTPVAATSRERDAKNRDDANVEEDAAALDKRLVAGALSVLSFIIRHHPQPKPCEALEPLLSSKLLWSSLSPANLFAGSNASGKSQNGATSSFGFDAPVVRIRAWTLLRDLHVAMPEVLDHQIGIYGTVAISAAWQERDVAVQRSMLDAILPILKARPSIWLIGSVPPQSCPKDRDDEDEDDDSDEEDEEEDDDEDGEGHSDSVDGGRTNGAATSRTATCNADRPRSFRDFQQWLQTGCGGSPTLGYPTVLVFLSTLPKEAFDAGSLEQATDLLTSLYSVLNSRDIDSDPAGSRAFLVSFCECTIYLCSRLFLDNADEAQRTSHPADLAQRHLGLVWRELVLALAPTHDDADALEAEAELKARRARIRSMGEKRIAAELVGSIQKLYNIDQEGRLGAGIMETIRSDLVAFAETASLATLDPTSAWSPSEVQGSLGQATSVLAGLLLAPPVMSEAARASKVRTVAATIAQEVLTKAADCLNRDAASAANRRFEISAKLDARAALMNMVVHAWSSAGLTIGEATSVVLEEVASQSLPYLTAQRCITPSVASSLLASYLPLCPDADSRVRIWHQVLGSVAKLSGASDQVEVLEELIGAAESIGSAPALDQLKETAASSGLDDVAIALTARLCDVDADPSTSKPKLKRVVSKLMIAPRPFVEASVAEQMLAIVTSTIEHLRFAAIQFEASAGSSDSTSERTRAARVLPDLLDCLKSWISAGEGDQNVRRLAASSASSGVVTAIFDLAFLAAGSASTATSVSTTVHGALSVSFQASKDIALETWKLMTASKDAALRDQVLRSGLASLSEQLVDLNVPVGVVVSAATAISQQLGSADPTAILPSANVLDGMLVRCARAEPSSTLSILDPTVSQTEPEEAAVVAKGEYDAEGLSSYARSALTLVKLLRNDRNLTRHKQYYLHHIVFLALLAEDELLQPSSSRQCYGPGTSRQQLEAVVQESVEVATVVFSALADGVDTRFHLALLTALQKREDVAGDGLDTVLSNVWSLSRGHHQSSHLARLFGRLLSGCLNFGSIASAEAERWLKLGRSVADAAPALAQATILTVKPYVEESPGYSRLCNELAASLAGLQPPKAATQGLALLRLLVATAPDIDSDVSLVPQQRAIFLLQALQRWIASDEEIPEEINVWLAQLFVFLIPIVQDLSGNHVDFFFDLVESNLDVASLTDDATLPGLYFTLQLLETLRDFALRNASLRAVWKERKDACLDLVRDRFLTLADDISADSSVTEVAPTSRPRETCAELIVDLVREVPSTSFDLCTTAAPLCKLMAHSPVHDVQVVSYRLVSASIKDRIKELVVEAAVDKGLVSDAEKRRKLAFPAALLSNVADALDGKLGVLVDEESARRAAFGYFLSWIAVFDHFEDASLQLKSLFISQLEAGQLVSASLLPSIFALAGLINKDRRPFDPSRWVVDEVYLDHLDPSSLSSIQVLASHVYFRALIHIPTLVRNWWLDIKDRQLSMLVSSFTARHCTPLIAVRELSHLKEPEALSRLQDEAMSIKILATNEVVATYTVDEHPMEIGVRIPPDFPLHGVEIRDIRRVGVSEAQWRAWLLAVQQLITGQNGLVFDALSLFKRNAEVQFEGLEECAICYSIISPMDRSLPTKPCKTCKNKFHAGCLFKWISTSGSSTCPLCRSIL